MSCSDISQAAGEPLAGSATRAERWLLVELRGAWGRDAVADTDIPAMVREMLGTYDGRVLLIRRPERRDNGTTVISATAADGGLGEARRLELGSLEELPGADLSSGTSVEDPVLLVCTHGRRDACCAARGVPVYEALKTFVGPSSLWQSSHQGGHRFAANLLSLPLGVQLGRVAPAQAQAAAALLAVGRIPLAHYRGRTLYEPRVQAAEVAVRRHLRLDAVEDLQLAGVSNGTVRFHTSAGEVEAHVEAEPGLSIPASCGADAAPELRYAVTLCCAIDPSSSRGLDARQAGTRDP